MKTCNIPEENISAYLDGELTTEERERLRGHLKQCVRCRQSLQTFREVWNYLDHYQLQPPSSKQISKFYSTTLPSHLIGKQENSQWFSSFIRAAASGIVLGIFLYQLFIARAATPKTEILQNLQLLKDPQFELIANLDLLESYEVFKYFTPEKLRKWKQKQGNDE